MRINHSAARNLPALPAPESLPIQPDERVLFLADLSMYGDEQDKFLGSSAQGRLVCALTTESLFIRTPYAIWSFDLAGRRGEHHLPARRAVFQGLGRC